MFPRFFETLTIRRGRRYTHRPGRAKPSVANNDNVESAALNTVTPLHPEPDAAGGAATLRDCVARSVRRYLVDLDGTPCTDGLYALMMREVEAPLLNEVLVWCGGNQSRAAAALGINRATLRKKLLAHGLA